MKAKKNYGAAHGGCHDGIPGSMLKLRRHNGGACGRQQHGSKG